MMLSAKPNKSVDPFFDKRQEMVERQIRGRGVADVRVLKAMSQVPRHIFVPENDMADAYEDYPLAIGRGQTISQPYIVAYMIEAARLNREDKVLEIGTGSGYQTAVLSILVDEVYSIDNIHGFIESAQSKLNHLGCRNVHLVHGDGYEGLSEHSPYDAIIVSAAPTEIPQNLISQMKIGGRMVIPIGGVFQELYLVTKTEKGIGQKPLLGVQFVPMVKEKLG